MRKIFTFLAVLVFMFTASSSWAATTWAELQTAFNSGGDVTLAGNITADTTDTALEIPDGKSVTLDLAGFTINRNNPSTTNAEGRVITVNGALTLKDSSTGKTGTITGGQADNGGGIYVAGSGKLYMEGGNITGNTANDGGGIYVTDSGTLQITGGSVTNNHAAINSGSNGTGGGIYVAGGDNKLISNCTITGNTAQGGGGGIYLNNAGPDITNCVISSNQADTYTGASSSFRGGGGILITSAAVKMLQKSQTASSATIQHSLRAAAFTMLKAQ